MASFFLPHVLVSNKTSPSATTNMPSPTATMTLMGMPSLARTGVLPGGLGVAAAVVVAGLPVM